MNIDFSSKRPEQLVDNSDQFASLFTFNLDRAAYLKHLTIKTSDYVPLYSLGFFKLDRDYSISHSNRFIGFNDFTEITKNHLVKIKYYKKQDGQIKNDTIDKFLDNNIVPHDWYISRSEYSSKEFNLELIDKEIEIHKENLKEVKEKLLCNSPSLSFGNIPTRYGRASYSNVFNSVNGLGQGYYASNVFTGVTHSLRNADYLTNLGFTAKFNSNNIEVLFSYMVKVEMIPYIRLCMLLGEEPHPDSLELWVNDTLDVPRGPHKNIRPRYRKEVKLFAESRGIKIEESSNLNADIFKSYKLPTFKNMVERRQWYNFIGSAVLNGMKKSRNGTGFTIKGNKKTIKLKL